MSSIGKKISSAPITIVKSGPRVALRCEVALSTPWTTGLVAVWTMLKRAGSGSHPVSYRASVMAPLIRSSGCQITPPSTEV